MKDGSHPFSSRLAAAAAALFAVVALTPPASAADASLEGTLTVRWGDPHPTKGKGGATTFRLDTSDGRSIPLAIAPDVVGTALTAQGKRVRIETGASGAATEATTTAGLPTTGLTVLPSATLEATTPQATVTKKVLFILLKFKGDTQSPHWPNFYKSLTNPYTAPTDIGIPATINQFYKATSYGKLVWKADVVGTGGLTPTGWLTLPKTKAGYAGCGWSDVCADLDGIAADALALVAAQGVSVTGYDDLAFVLNNDLDCCAWGGGYTYNGKSYGATWEPPWGQEAGTYVHEFGHSLGLPHSGWVYYAYDSGWDQMSRGTQASQLNCGSYKSANSGNVASTLYCSEPGSGFLTSYKDYLGWIPAANIKTISTVSTTNVTLEATALPLATAYKEVKICIAGQACTGSTAHYLSVEARINNAQYEKGLPHNGIVIHDVIMNRSAIPSTSCFFNLQFGWARTVDSTPGDYDTTTCDAPSGTFYPNYGLHNAQFAVGKTYTNRNFGISVKVVSSTRTGYTIQVVKSK